MLTEKNILVALQEAARTALYEAADVEIKKCMDRFENEMLQAKREIVGRMVNQIQVIAMNSPANGEYVIQIRLNGGKNGN